MRLLHAHSCIVFLYNMVCEQLLMLQASPVQQAELQKIKALHDKLSSELSGLTEKMETLQTQPQFQGIDGAKSQVVLFLQAAVVLLVRDAITVQFHPSPTSLPANLYCMATTVPTQDAASTCVLLGVQVGQQISIVEGQLTRIMQELKSVQANNRKQGDMLQSQRAAVSGNAELVQIERLEEAVQQAREVGHCPFFSCGCDRQSTQSHFES